MRATLRLSDCAARILLGAEYFAAPAFSEIATAVVAALSGLQYSGNEVHCLIE